MRSVDVLCRRGLAALALAALAASGCSEGGGAAPLPAPADGGEQDDDRPSPRCPVAGDGVVAGTVTHPELVEASGLAASARTPGVLYTHNDSGDRARIFALEGDARVAAEIEVTGADAVDWEAIAAAPFEGAPALFIGDIGDNRATRQTVTIYVVHEPSLTPPPASVDVLRRLDLTYEDGPRDAEALLVDPRDGTILVATKRLDGEVGIYVADVARSTLERAATLEGLPWVTDGAVSSDGSLIALRTYGKAFVWRRPEGASIAETLARGERCPLTLEGEPQGEAIAFAADGRAYFTLSERANRPLWRFALTPALEPPTLRP